MIPATCFAGERDTLGGLVGLDVFEQHDLGLMNAGFGGQAIGSGAISAFNEFERVERSIILSSVAFAR